MYTIRLIVTIFVLLFSNFACIANQSSNIRIVKRSVNLIVIDPGLGGPETGPPGCVDNIFSKDINLMISKKIAEKVKKDLGLDTILTRETDDYVSLEERTAIANTRNADLFISIHVNGFYDPKVYGIETYCLKLVVDEDTETAAINKKRGMDAIQKKLVQHVDGSESKSLAEKVQSSLVASLETKYDNIRDRGVKNAPLYVLMGASMPAIVAYPSFITNVQECERLMTEEYQDAVAAGIVEGLRKYIKQW
jgi:N-acetylmuramoyl-L-alanine amidase